MRAARAAAALLLLGSASRGVAMMHDLQISHDERALYKIEAFCFVAGGVMNVSVDNFAVYAQADEYRAGFVMRRTVSESAAQQELEESLESDTCLLDVPPGSKVDERARARACAPPLPPSWLAVPRLGKGFFHPASPHVASRAQHTAFVLDLSDKKNWKHANKAHVVAPGDAGLYSLIFTRCSPGGAGVGVSFKLHAEFYNPGPDYLSACESALPALFMGFFVLFGGALVAWIAVLCLSKGGVHHVHRMMAILLLLKTAAMLSESIRYQFIARTGSGEGWSVVYYVFSFLKGVMLFVVILLIGTGWSLLKPYLHDREKRIILVVLCLQVIDNVAMVVLEETAPGSQASERERACARAFPCPLFRRAASGRDVTRARPLPPPPPPQVWLTWRDVLHLVDIICCCAILFPIVWSIRHLRQAAGADGKAENNLMKLTLFRQFYIMVVTYIYFTRIVVFLLAATLPFQLLWLRYLFTEVATFAFYVITGYKFKPAEDNPYLPVAKDDPELDDGEGGENLEEFGLDEGVELPGLKQAVPTGPAGPTAPGPTEGVLREKVAAD